MRSQMEMKSMLLETEGKVLLVIKRQRIWLNLFYIFLWNIDVVSNDHEYLAEDIS